MVKQVNVLKPVSSKMSNRCVQCKQVFHKHTPIYWFKQRRTDEEIKQGVERKGAIVLHNVCANEWVINNNNGKEGIEWQLEGTMPTTKPTVQYYEPLNDNENETLDEEQDEFTPMLPIESPTPSTTQTNDLLSLIATSVLPLVKAQLDNKLDVKQVQSLIQDALAMVDRPLTIEIKRQENQEVVSLGLQHFMFPELLAVSQALLDDNLHLNVWIAGPAGSGKSKAGEYVAKALNLSFAYTGSFNESHKVMGFVSPIDHTYHRTPFRDAYENGGVFMFDDFDGSDPVCGIELLGMLANGHAAFPDGMVAKHKDCLILISANTWGHGATSDYVGRLKQDKALLNRFVMLDWQYDEKLESATSGNIEWAKRVQAIRRNVMAKGLKVLVTPRATYQGAALLRAGLTQTQVEKLVIANSMSSEQWNMVK